MRPFFICGLLLCMSTLVNGNTVLRSTVQSQSRKLSASGDVNECFNSTDEEFMTARDWWNNTKLSSPFPDTYGNRSHWMTQRQPGQPIFGDNTMVAGVLYTFDTKMLKMNIFFPPLYPQENRKVTVFILVASHAGSFGWQGASTNCEIQEHTWYCPVRVAGLDTSRAYNYLVQYSPDPINDPQTFYLYAGSIPAQEGYPRIASLSCFGPDDTNDKTALVQAILDTEPDLLLLQGDQSYMHDALGYGFLELIYSINALTKNIPTLVQMDDHDYGEGNLWGAAFANETSGSGFHKSVCVINAIQELYMSHMPDPVSNKTLDNGIGIAYTNYRYGSVDFAILESRKFKSEMPNGSLLGTDQEAWLEDWCANADGSLKVVLAQTPFAALGTNVTRIPWPYGVTGATKSIDTNGFPVDGRNRFMDIAKGCTQLVLSGDQHVALAVTYDDYGISECASPAAINDVFWRLNFGALNVTRLDGWGNEYRLLNVWNVDDRIYESYNTPSKTRFTDLAVKGARADGFLVVDLDGSSATCSVHSYRESHDVIWSVEVPASVYR